MKQQRKRNHNFVRLFMLLAFLLVGMNASWAQDVSAQMGTNHGWGAASKDYDDGLIIAYENNDGDGVVNGDYFLLKPEGTLKVAAPSGKYIKGLKVYFNDSEKRTLKFTAGSDSQSPERSGAAIYTVPNNNTNIVTVTCESGVNITKVDVYYTNAENKVTLSCNTTNTVAKNQIVAGDNMAYSSANGKFVAMSRDHAYMYIYFNGTTQHPEYLNLSDLKHVTISKTGDNLHYSFIKSDDTFYGDFQNFDRDFSTEETANLTAVKGIRIDNQWKEQEGQINSISLRIEHAARTKPTLKAPTANSMEVAKGTPVVLQLTDTHGYWREYNKDYSQPVKTRIPDGEYNSAYTFNDLEVGDYYFEVKDGGDCALGKYHESAAERVHVKVLKATLNVTCQSASISLANLNAYGNTTYNAGQYVVSGEYNKWGNGLKVVFENPQNFSNVNTITVYGTEFNVGDENIGIPFTDTDGNTHWPSGVKVEDGNTIITLNTKNNDAWSSIRTIDLRGVQPGTHNITSIVVDFNHKPATPKFSNGTSTQVILARTSSQATDLVLSTSETDNTYWRQYDAINGNVITTNIPENEAGKPVRTVSGLATGVYYFATRKTIPCEFGHYHDSDNNWVTVYVEESISELPAGFDMIKQPIFEGNHKGVAKEYVAIANLTAKYKENNVDKTEPVASNWSEVLSGGSGKISGIGLKETTDDKALDDEDDGASKKQKLTYILGVNEYDVNATDGLCISQYGKAGVVANQTMLPTRATLAFKASGTMDFYLITENKLPKSGVDDKGNPIFVNADRRHIKIWYRNDQSNELKPLICANNNTDNDFWFYGKRNEDKEGADGAPLYFGVRLQHLGSDGTCEVFITYEDEVSDENVWIKGFLVKRPDLKVTIGRTDKLHYTDDKPNNDNCAVTCYGENKPYYWDFGTSGFSAIKPGTTEEVKKVNEFDGRTYVCGVGPNGEQLIDHLLVYSDGEGLTNKANFDGRKTANGNAAHLGYNDPNDYNEHIEFNHPTSYDSFKGDRRAFNPILSNGLKVNVTGSGWFTIACAAPNGPVKMKVLSSTNGGVAYMNVLREFDVPKGNSDIDWKEYKVYLRAHVEKDGNAGFWDGNIKKNIENGVDKTIYDPEETQMSLYVVFDAVEDYEYKDNGEDADAQLNIHFLQWLNEEPVEYNFQREEDPKLLSEMQTVGNSSNPDFYWQMGTSIKENEMNTYNVNDQATKTSGQESTYDKASTKNSNGGKGAGYVWNIAAPANTNAHTEAAAAAAEYKYDGTTEFAYNAKNNEFNIPISGSFLRICSMKNNYIAAHFVQNRVGSSPEIYVVDETGKPVPYCDGADTFNETNLGKFTTEARMRGCVSSIVGLTQSGNGYSITNADEAFRIDIIAPAGKEFFIFAKDAALSLARLESISWRVNNTPVPGINGTLELSDAANNTSAIQAAMNGTGRYATSVTLNRDFTAGNWASLVLPFSMNEEKFKEVFGKDAICLHFTDVDLTTNTVNLTHHFYNMIVAGRPVLVRPSAGGSIVNGNKTISDVTLQTSAVIPNVNGSFTFTGSFDNASMPANSLFISGNAVKHASEEKTGVKALRAWFVCLGLKDIQNPSQQGARAARFVNYDGTLMDEDMATGIETALAESGMDATVISASTVIYNLQGNKVATGAEMQNLPAGVYVVKGKKFIVK